MSPLLVLVAGSNGAGKSTLVQRVLAPVYAGLPFINADEIAHARWPGEEMTRTDEARAVADAMRDVLLERGASFITETVFSHPSKVEIVRRAAASGYLVHLHVVIVPRELAVVRVRDRVADGGHDVPETKIRARYERLWGLVAQARGLAARTTIYDNGRATTPFRPIAEYEHGLAVGTPAWPTWTPLALR